MSGNAIHMEQQEIERLRHRVRELEIEREALKRSSRLRTALIMVAAHDLRSPMTSLVGYVELMSGGRLGPLPQSLRRPIEILQRNLHWLRRLTDHLCELGRMEKPCHLMPVDALKLVETAVAEIRGFAEAQERVLVLSTTTVPEILSDGPQLHFALINLLVAAVKRSQPGQSIEITVSSTPAQEVQIAISERGALPALVHQLFANGGRERLLEHLEHFDASVLRLALASEVLARNGGRLLVQASSSGSITALVFEPRS
jgi:two-component system phosphate regulon sensor histidine kinase PhoR